MQIELTDQPIDVAAVLAAAESEEAGAVNAFIGTVRNKSTGRPVVRSSASMAGWKGALLSTDPSISTAPSGSSKRQPTVFPGCS